VQILGDESKRSNFDKYGPASQQPGFDPDAYARASSSFGGAGGFADFFGGGGGPGMGGAQSDIFDSLFSAFRTGGRAGPVAGDDIEASISINFLDACKGVKRTVEVHPVVDCDTCHGSGLKPGRKRDTCKVCGGTGQRAVHIQSGFTMATRCNACDGAGTVTPPGSACSTCGGMGKVRKRKTVEVEVPPGVEDGMKVRIPGAGDASLHGKGPSGDLLVRINVLPSKVFRRQGANLYHDRTVPFYTAILGGKVRVPTLEGDVDVKVPPGTQPGEEMVLRNRGVQKLFKQQRGDLFVHFDISLPR
jgi:molecular chaperone DnaJ